MFSELMDVGKIYTQDEELKKEDVYYLSKWLETQQHLPELNEFQVALFLHSCRYQTELAKSTIEKYFTLRSTSDLFQNVSQDLVKNTLGSFFICFLPKRTPKNEAVLWVKLLDTRPEIYNSVNHTKVFLLILSLYFHQYGPAKGVIVVFDMVGTTFGHIWRINIPAVRQLAYFTQEAAYVRLKHIHFIYASPLAGRLIALVRPLLKKEVYEMIRFHTDSLESFCNSVPKELLPEDYGGPLPSLLKLREKNVENIIDHWDFVQWHNTQRINECKLSRKPKGFLASIFGSS